MVAPVVVLLAGCVAGGVGVSGVGVGGVSGVGVGGGVGGGIGGGIGICNFSCIRSFSGGGGGVGV